MKWGKKDPELYVLGAIYAGIFGAAGFHLGELTNMDGKFITNHHKGKKGGNAKPEKNVAIPPEGMPWEGPDADANKDNPNYKCKVFVKMATDLLSRQLSCGCLSRCVPTIYRSISPGCGPFESAKGSPWCSSFAHNHGYIITVSTSHVCLIAS